MTLLPLGTGDEAVNEVDSPALENGMRLTVQPCITSQGLRSEKYIVRQFFVVCEHPRMCLHWMV